MSRTITQAVSDRLGNDSYVLGDLVEMQFAEGSVRLTDMGHDVEWNGFTWLNVGHLLTVTQAVEDSTIEIAPWSVSLSGVDQSQLAIALSYSYIDRLASRWIAVFYKNSGQVVPSPILVSRGLTDAPVIEDQPDGTSTITVRVTSQWGDIDGKNGRHTNDEQQQSLFPGDQIFSMVTQTPRRLLWGSK